MTTVQLFQTISQHIQSQLLSRMASSTSTSNSNLTSKEDSNSSHQGKWQPKTPFQSGSFLKPVTVGSKIWFTESTHHGTQDLKGIIEYDPDSDSTSPAIPYPETFYKSPLFLRSVILCKYRRNSIIIIHRLNGCGIVFNTETQTFSDIFSVNPKSERLGWISCCVVIGDYMHVFHKNSGDPIIASLTDKALQNVRRPYPNKSSYQVYSVLVQDDEHYQPMLETLVAGFTRNAVGRRISADVEGLITKLCTFGLLAFGVMDGQDAFHFGTLTGHDPTLPIDWKLASEYKLQHTTDGFGYIQHGPFIVMFGGVDPLSEDSSIDDICILDLRKKTGWIQSPMRCPRQGRYDAVLDSRQNVHLYTQFDLEAKHFCVKLMDLFPPNMQAAV